MNEVQGGDKSRNKESPSSVGEGRPKEAEEAKRTQELKRQAAEEEHKERERRQGRPLGKL